MKKTVLGVKVDLLNRQEVVDLLREKIRLGKFFHVVTAYSEFFVIAQIDKDFRNIVSKADLVIADGIGPLAAINYFESLRPDDNGVLRFLKGMLTGVKVLAGKVGVPVPGVWLFGKLIEEASNHGWKVFLLGGFGDEVLELEKILKAKHKKLKLQSCPGVQKLTDNYADPTTIKTINNFAPDLLFVAYGQVKQEKWINANKDNLNVKIVVGVGSTFDELTGRLSVAPGFVEKLGLKWFWRLICEPRRWRRIINGVIIFPWLVFTKSNA